MDVPGMNHNLIERMLRMLSVAQEERVDIGLLSQGLAEPDRLSSLDPAASDSFREMIAFMDEMPGGFLIYRADADEQIIYANKALLRIFMCDTFSEFQTLTRHSFKGLVHPDDLAAVEKSIAEQIAQSQNDLDYVEYRIIRRDGAIRWVEDYGHFIQSEAVGGIFYVFITDATEKKKRQLSEKATLINEKEEKEHKLQTLIAEYDKERKQINQEQLRRLEVIEGLSINYASILYVDLDADKVLPYRLSVRTEHQFGVDFKAHKFSRYTSDYVNTWVHPDDRAMVLQAAAPEYIRAKLSNSKTFYVNYRILSEEGEQYLQLRIVNVSSDKPVSQIVMGYRSVDEEILRERQQQQVLEEALNNARLANNAKNTFLSNMSHDMRTPLNAIFGYTALAKKHIDQTDVALEYIDKIELAGRQLLELIEKVLEISWIESRDIHLAEAECNLGDILQDLQKALSPQASRKGIRLHVNSTQLEHCDIYGDKEKIKQFLLYLSNNAIKYTPSGGEINIVARELEQHSNEYAVYQFVVQDTGIGISEEFMKHMFEPFEREQNTTFSGVYGTGLGLTIAKHIIEVMDGTIYAESTVGVGSTFTVTVQFRIQTCPLLSSADTDQILMRLMEHKILLVDDNEINLEIETEILQGLGLRIETAQDGHIAVDKVKNAQPDEYALVLMDIQMPVMDGHQAAEAIRRIDDPALSGIPIVALSANAFESDKRRSMECGMNAHLTKPIDVPLLLETMANILYSHRISDLS